jgi:hypothetical protein
MQFFNRDKFIFYYSIIKGKIKITCNHLTGELGPLHNTTWPIHFQSAYLGWSRAHISGSQDPSATIGSISSDFRTRLFIRLLPSRDRGERDGGAALRALRETPRREEGWRPVVAPVRLWLRRETETRGSASGKAVKPVIAAARVPIRQPVPHRWCR